ncbi:hypothetical protein [Burkholderia pseudomallei]|uniref:hypothetical protein n=1 Tax=Burkholderia pseudomallei TaxID=28450 RepID=UPI000A5181CA|nr:hypothetical protein [Burkholderia pseudomallei]
MAHRSGSQPPCICRVHPPGDRGFFSYEPVSHASFGAVSRYSVLPGATRCYPVLPGVIRRNACRRPHARIHAHAPAARNISVCEMKARTFADFR